MVVEMISLQPARTYRDDWEGPRCWELRSYHATFLLCGCAAPLADVIDVVESLDGLALEECVSKEGGYVIVIAVDAGGWRAAAEALTAAVRRLPSAPPKPGPVEMLLDVDRLELDVGHALVPLVDAAKGGDLVDRIGCLRRQFAVELGIILPPIRIRDKLTLEPNGYLFKIKGHPAASGVAYPGQFLAIDNGATSGPLAAAETADPAFGLRAYWVSEAQRAEAERLSYTVVEAGSVLTTHLSEVIKANAHVILTRQDVHSRLHALAARAPDLVAEVVPLMVPVRTLHAVLKEILKRGASVRDIETILETLARHPETTDAVELAGHILRENGGGPESRDIVATPLAPPAQRAS